MKQDEPVTRLMSGKLTVIQKDESVAKLRRLFDDCEIHYVPVVNGEKLLGIVRMSDLLRISFGEFGELDAILDHTYRLEDVMSSNPITVSSQATVRDAAKLLGAGSFHALPVVDGETLIGIVTSTDLINYLVE